MVHHDDQLSLSPVDLRNIQTHLSILCTEQDMSSEPTPDAEYKGRTKDLGREARLSFRNIAEHQLRRELKEIALETCDPVIKSFAECSQEKGLMVVFSCREQFKQVNECLNKHNGEEAWQKYKAAHEDEIDRRATGGGMRGK